MVTKYRELRKKSKGFTLIELMIVVAIIAILAAIAIPQYRKFQLKSKTSEAKTNLGAIRTCEEAYSAEHDVYLTVANTPTSIPGSTAVAWPTTAGTGGVDYFDSLGFRPAGNVYYMYGVEGYTTGNTPSESDVSSASGSNGTNAVEDGNADILIYAKGDLDGDSSNSAYGCTDENPKIVGPAGDDF